MESQDKEEVGGYIAYYSLQDWWVTTFTETEREYMDERYQSHGSTPCTLTQGKLKFSSLPASQFLSSLSTWFRAKKDAFIAQRIHEKVVDLGKSDPIERAGYYRGRHFTTYVNDVKNLKRAGKLDEAEKLLLELVNATENQSKSEDCGVAPAYYGELAKIYRKRKDYQAEISILERFAGQRHAPGVMPKKLLERLERAYELEART